MKKNILFFLIIVTSISMVWALQVSKAKYKDRTELDIYLTSAKMYFQDTGSDVTIPYSDNNANIEFNVHNYTGQDVTLQDINYNISISNSNYTFNINNTLNANNNSVSMTLTGGDRNSETIQLNFQRLNTTNVPSSEEIEITISTDFPYTYSKTFVVTIVNGDIEVQGNPTNWTRNNVTLTVVPSIPEMQLTEYSFDNGETWITNNSKEYTENINGLNILAKDNLGQTLGPITIDITKIDKTSPTMTFANSTEYETDGTTKQVETLIVYLGERTSVNTGVTATDTQSGISEQGVKCYRNDIQITTTNYFSQVGRYSVTYKVQDEVGNETEEDREILVRWPLAGKYVVARQNYVAVGHSSSTSADGLYKDNADTGANVGLPFASKYYYAGANVDNYITFADTTFRILNIPTNDDLKILGDISDTKVGWGPSSDTNNRKIYLSNVFNTWSTKWWPRGQIYNHEDSESHYKLFTEIEKAHLDLATFYAGRFNKADAVDIAYTVYYEQTGGINLGGDDNPAFQGYSAFPNVSDYLKASKAHDIVPNIDESQVMPVLGIGTNKRKIFSDNSWIDMSKDQWTINSKNLTNTDNDFWVVDAELGSNIRSRTFYYDQQYRVVFYLKNNTILSGIGTTSNPFNVEEDWAWFDQYQIVQ